MWGLAAIYSYRAYGDPLFLDQAMQIWDQTIPWMVTPNDADRGSYPGKQGSLAPDCHNGKCNYGFTIEIDKTMGPIASHCSRWCLLRTYCLSAASLHTIRNHSAQGKSTMGILPSTLRQKGAYDIPARYRNTPELIRDTEHLWRIHIPCDCELY